MTYREALERLFALRRFGVRPGLDGTRRALATVGNPERGLVTIHVAGTNGKGSTAAFTERILREGGVRTGLYTSPHLLRFTERIQIAGDEISDDEAAELAARVLDGAPETTFFEVATAMAFAAFRARGVEVAVVEAGLGGRLDSTNVVEAPRATVVTGIALDHTDVLGPTLLDIAREKAGIFKAGSPAIFACDDEAAAAVLDARAREAGAPVARLGRDFDGAWDPDGSFRYNGKGGTLRVAKLGLRGAHQAKNAALALAAAAELGAFSDEVRARALANVNWPGRLELLEDRTGFLKKARSAKTDEPAAPSVITDAAHNPDGARTLAAEMKNFARPIALVFGVVADKDAAAMLAALAPAADRVVLTRPSTPRARDPETLRPLAPNASDAIVTDSLAAALAEAARPPAATVVVAGSIFLVGEARRLLTGERADPLAVQDPPASREKL